jgi:hypothetical protein
MAVDHVSLLAGTTYRGDYEERIRRLVAETSAAPDVVLFIDELHNLIGQGTALGVAMDAGNMLKPALVRGDFRGHWAPRRTTNTSGGYVAIRRSSDAFSACWFASCLPTKRLDILKARVERPRTASQRRHHRGGGCARPWSSPIAMSSTACGLTAPSMRWMKRARMLTRSRPIRSARRSSSAADARSWQAP